MANFKVLGHEIGEVKSRMITKIKATQARDRGWRIEWLEVTNGAGKVQRLGAIGAKFDEYTAEF